MKRNLRLRIDDVTKILDLSLRFGNIEPWWDGAVDSLGGNR